MRATFITVIVAAGLGVLGGASAPPSSAQGIYLDLGPNRGPGPYYRDYDEPRYRYRERSGDRGERGYYRPGRFRTFNGCQNGWTVQDGLCKPYRGY
jgi:hypothetical protein